MPSPIGPLGVELHGRTVTRLHIDPKREELPLFTPFRDLERSDFLDEAFGRLSEYFAGARRHVELEFDLAPCGVTGFARRVLKETAKISYGRTCSYQRIAASAGRPDAYRLVLSTLVANPIPILIPCHRVVTHKSGVGSYVAGRSRKKWLLAMEKEGLDFV